MKNSSGLSPLALALSEELQDTATELLKGGADVNVTDNEGLTLLHLSLLDENCDSALFLLNNGADVNVRTKSNQTCLEIGNLILFKKIKLRLHIDARHEEKFKIAEFVIHLFQQKRILKST